MSIACYSLALCRVVFLFFYTRKLELGGEGQLLALPFALRGRGGVPFKYKEYHITVSFQGAFS